MSARLVLAAAAALVIALPGRTAAQEPAATGITATQRQTFTGSYTASHVGGKRVSFRIFEEDGVLLWQQGERRPRRLLHLGGNVFYPEGSPDFVMAFRVERGRAASFTLLAERGAVGV